MKEIAVLKRLLIYVLDRKADWNRICRETWALWSLCPGLGAARFAEWPENTKKFLMRRRHIDRHAVRIGELELAVLTLSKQFHPKVPFRASRFWRQRGVSIDQRGEIFFEIFHVFDSESQMIHVSRLDPGALVIGDCPRRNNHGQAAVA